MYLLVGLGNIGIQYSATRHNVGFEVIERIAYEHQIKLNQKKHKALIGQGLINGNKIILAQPQTYMNASGISVKLLSDFYKIDKEKIIVIFDDTSLNLGQIRIRKKGSAGGHNGIKSIINNLGTQEFPRVKIGVGNKPPNWDLADYVLSRFAKDEIIIITETIKKANDAIEVMLRDGIDKAMNQYNKIT